MASQRKLDEFAADYVAGSLSEAEAAEFARLLVENPELQAEVNQLEKAVGLALHELPMMTPPPQLRAAVLDQIGLDQAVPDRVETPVLRPQRSPWTLWVFGSIAVVTTGLSLVLGLDGYRLRLVNQQLRQSNQLLTQDLLESIPAQQAQLILQQPSTRFYDFAGTEQAADAFGSMIVDTDGLRAAIAFQKLPALSSDQTYALWVRHQGQYVPCGDFQTNQDGAVFVTLPMPPVYQSRPWVTDVIVTVEPADLPAQPNGPIVAATI